MITLLSFSNMQNKEIITLHVNTYEYFLLAFKGPDFKEILTGCDSMIQIIWRFINQNRGPGQANFSHGETPLPASTFRARQRKHLSQQQKE